MREQQINKYTRVFQSAIYQVNSTAFITARDIFTVDPGFLPHEINRICQYVDSHKFNRRINVIFTHADYDHISGYCAFQGARTIASKAFVSTGRARNSLHDLATWDNQHYISRPCTPVFPKIDLQIGSDAKAMHFSGSVVTFYTAPGHTADGLMIVLEPAGVLIAGDYLSDLEVPFIEHSLKAYKKTLSKIERIVRVHQISQVVPGHGNPALTEDEIKRRLEASFEYIEDLEHHGAGTVPFPEEKYRKRYPLWDGFSDIHSRQLLSTLP